MIPDRQYGPILVVDDEAEIRKLVENLLGRVGLETLLAANVAEARQFLAEHKPELIVLDLMMPEVSGIDFLKELRSDNQYDDLPVVILSALVDPLQIREGLDAGADRYLTKPYLSKNLIQTVQDILKRGRNKG